eukprot:gene23997-24015_t
MKAEKVGVSNNSASGRITTKTTPPPRQRNYFDCGVFGGDGYSDSPCKHYHSAPHPVSSTRSSTDQSCYIPTNCSLSVNQELAGQAPGRAAISMSASYFKEAVTSHKLVLTNKSLFLSYDSFRKAFEDHEPELVSTLATADLSGNSLASLPIPLYRMEAMTALNLSGNNLGTELLSSSRWQALETLDLSSCGLVQIPPMLLAMTPLKSLNVSNNQLRHLPM